MNQHFKSKTLVIGAGGGGIASALLAAKRGEEVTLLESHSNLGGCASFFKRGSFLFDVGATTLSGVGVGRPLGDLFELLGEAPELYSIDPGITFHLSSGKVISYQRDFDLWMHELHRHFPGLDHRPFWNLVQKINKESWGLLRDVRTFPFVNLSDFMKVLKHPQHIRLIPHLLISTEIALKKFGLDHPEYLELVNGILLISAQANSENIPFVVGAMALSYPSETFAPKGGMKGLMDFFEVQLLKNNVKIRKKIRVEKILPGKAMLTDGNEIRAERLIVNLPVWNMAGMTEGAIHSNLVHESAKHPGSWGALTLYFGVRSEIASTYHQVHLKHQVIQNYFVSFSMLQDETRAPHGYQTVTISTHVWAEDFGEQKEYFAKIIMNDFMERFSVSEIKFFNIGTPKTFERFTGRKSGFVGGLPFLYGKNPLASLSPVTSEESIFRVGDTVFPGQGLCGVVAGAMQLHHRLRK